MSIEIITTSDGSHSLFNSSLNETYHSRHGAVQESIYVFIRNGFDRVLLKSSPVRIFEVGFGTGLNAWLTIHAAADKHKAVEYYSVEAFPLDATVFKLLNYPEQHPITDGRKMFDQLHLAPWDQPSLVTPDFVLNKIQGHLQTIQVPPSLDLIYFDAFAPSRQPEMWEMPVLKKVCDQLMPGGVFATYCAKGQLKRDLKALGMEVETLPGPPGKKEMVRAIKN